MNDKKPVIVYGASGYTGRLVCEYLRQYNIAFIAAGRNAKRIAEVMKQVPGIETANYEVVAVENDVAALTELFTGAQVVCNIVGPFDRFGEAVVQAALAANIHYLDTTGEPAFIDEMINKYSATFKEKGLCFAPSTAYMYTPAEICARTALEAEPTIDTLEAVTCSTFIPTFASTQSIFSLFNHQATYLKENEMHVWPPGKGYEVSVPGHSVNRIVHPWGGGFLPQVFKNNPTVHTCRQYSGNTDRELMEYIIGIQNEYEENVKSLPSEEEQQAAMNKLIDDVEPFMPPREMQLVHRTTDVVNGTGSAGGKKVVFQCSGAYTITGILQAASVSMLIRTGTQKSGFVSACEAVGYKYLLSQIKNFLPCKLTVTDI